MATIYRIKTKFVNVFGFLYISKCSELTIFGVKVTLKSIDPKFSYLACRKITRPTGHEAPALLKHQSSLTTDDD